MARIPGIRQGGSLLARLAFLISRLLYGKVLQPLRVGAHDTRLLLAFGHMELAQQRARQMPREKKQLARMLAGIQVGCPWCIDMGVLWVNRWVFPKQSCALCWTMNVLRFSHQTR